MVIQALSIPTHSSRTEPSPHVVYNISVSTPTTHYTLPQRYSAFVDLQTALTQEVGEHPPGELPSRRKGGWFGLGGGAMTEEQLSERRTGLERWLRGLLASRDPRWAGARCFREFIAAPPSASTLGSSDDCTTQPHFTSSNWLIEHSALVELARSIRSTLAERDASLLNSSSTAHGLNASAKKSLVDMVTRLSGLTRALQELGRQGMTDGEVRRRSEMLGRLQEEAETLGNLAAGGPRVGAGRIQAMGGGGLHSGAGQHAALVGASAVKTPTRVLGASSVKAQETAETRPLDNAGLLSLQQTYMDQQDTKLDSLTAALRRQRALGEMIGEELRVHDELLDQLESSTDRVTGRLKDADKLAKKL